MTAQCHREVADRDGMVRRCGQPATGLRPDGDVLYAVCHRHLPTDAEMDEYAAGQHARWVE